MPCYSCLTSWRPEETGAAARGGRRADIQVLVLATTWVVCALLDPTDERSRILDHERTFILVHGFMPYLFDIVRDMFDNRDDSGYLCLRVPFPATPCPACGVVRPSTSRATRPSVAPQPTIGSGLSSLQQVNSPIAQAADRARRLQARLEAQRQAEQERRDSLWDSAHQEIRIVSDSLKHAILSVASAAREPPPPTGYESEYRLHEWAIMQGSGMMLMSYAQRFPATSERSSDCRQRRLDDILELGEVWTADHGAPFDFIAFSGITVGNLDSRDYIGRHSFSVVLRCPSPR